MKRVIEFDDSDLPGENIRSAELLLRGQVQQATERAGFIVESVDPPRDTAEAIVRALAQYNDASTLMQNSIATIVQLGHGLIEEAESRADPTIDQALGYAVIGMDTLLTMLPPEAYTAAAELRLQLTRYRTYVEGLGLGSERRSTHPDSGDSGTDGGGTAGAAAERDRGPGPGPGGDHGTVSDGGRVPAYLRGSRSD